MNIVIKQESHKNNSTIPILRYTSTIVPVQEFHALPARAPVSLMYGCSLSGRWSNRYRLRDGAVREHCDSVYSCQGGPASTARGALIAITGEGW